MEVRKNEPPPQPPVTFDLLELTRAEMNLLFFALQRAAKDGLTYPSDRENARAIAYKLEKGLLYG